MDYKLVGDVGDGTEPPPVFPDLVVDSLAVSPTPVVTGEELAIQFLLTNQGEGDATAFQTNVRLNTSATEVSTSDALLYFCEVDGLAAGVSTDACNSSVQVPAGLPAGQYYVWVITDVNSEAGQLEETNDLSSTPVQVVRPASALISPVSNARVTRGYAAYVDADGDGDDEFHAGTDFVSNVGNLDIVAAASGRVRTIPVGTYGNVESENFGMGNVVIIDHTADLGVYTLYAHLASITVANGQQVEAGERIGIMGDTGLTTGVHLHFEVKDRGVLSGSRADDARPWGYTSLDSLFTANTAPNVPGHPAKYGFHNPMTFLNYPVTLLDIPTPLEIQVPGQPIHSSPVASDSTLLANTPVLGNERAAFTAIRRIGDAWYNVHIPNLLDEGWSASGWIHVAQDETVLAELNPSLEYIEAVGESIAIYDEADIGSERVAFAYGDGLALPQQFVVLEETTDWYRVALPDFMSAGDGWVSAGDVSLFVPTSTEEPEGTAVSGVYLAPNYPNPFTGTTHIPIHLEEPGSVSLRVYDMLGREVAVLIDSRVLTGKHTVPFDAARLPSGVYMVRMQAGEVTQHRFMSVVK